MDDARLVGEFQASGDPASFERLVERHRERVFRVIVSVLGSGYEGEAEELTQEVFLKVYRKLGGFRGDAKFSSWLFRIAYNQAVSHRARARFRMPHHGEEMLESAPSAAPRDDPLAAAARACTTAAVGRCLAQLPDAHRSALHLYYWMGFTVPEIGGALGVPEGTVKSYLHRGRARLRRLLPTEGITHA